MIMLHSDTPTGVRSRTASGAPPKAFTGGWAEPAGDWMPRYDRYVFDQVEPFLKGSICEVGSGLGRFTRYLAGHEKVTALEPDGASHLLALQQFAHQINIKHVHRPLEDCPNDEVPAGAYDTVLCLNRLECVTYDITMLEIMGELLSDQGHVIVVASAMPQLYGPADRRQGRLRRYSAGVLAGAFEQAGLQVTRHFFFNLPGLCGWWLASRLLKRCAMPHTLQRLSERGLPWLAAAERLLKPPRGLSLLMVGRRR